MLFNSLEFAVFFPCIFILYWFVFNRSFRVQNFFLLVGSYIFYGWWDYRFLFLLMFSTFLDYFTGLKMGKAKRPMERKFWFLLSIVVNLGFLGFFKYYNFFIESFAYLLTTVGVKTNPWTLQIILPVGISFYTFHGMSYVIDIYKRRIQPTINFIDYGVFVSFFPLLVAGPIERATHLLPQIKQARIFNYSQAVDGMRQILWGLFKKIVIADNCAEYVNTIFGNYGNYGGSTLALGAVLFAFQIYGDFSGYSDIALGISKLLGIELLRNFAYPYFARDIAEFWRRWHISLTTWFRDYLYIPLGGSKGSAFSKIKNTFIIFLISGFWHGANWTFLFWGFLNAIYFLPLLILNKNREHLDLVAEGNLLPSLKELLQIITTFSITTIAWIFFRANTITDAFHYMQILFSTSLFTTPALFDLKLIILLVTFIVWEWVQRDMHHALQFKKNNIPKLLRWSVYYTILLLIFFFGGTQQNFIYFQF